ncbi:MAG: AAA family ATPase [Sphingobium sp.]|uniref:AAA family ATPase n=1 Tax=Sphingobium sp. TaxID=1912891 RepID=UPI003BAF3EA7
MDFADMEPDDVASRINGATPTGTVICATPYRWPDPSSLPTRQWLLGHWLLRGEVTAIIAPGGTGKSTIGTALALSLASGQPLLGKPLPRGPQSAWIYNLEDSQDELDRQVSAACLFHGIGPNDCGNRLCVDSGLVQPLCTATEDRDGFSIAEGVFAQVAATVLDRGISVVIVDPFVSSHTVRESSNEAIDAIAKRWKRLAQETGCAVVLVHHTKKLGGREVTAEDGRGAVALRDAARVVLPLNAMSQAEAEELGVTDPALRRSLVRVDTGKANRAPPDAATWIKLESQCLDNGDASEPADYVAVACLWERPDVLHGLNVWHVSQVQSCVAAGHWRDNAQAKDWVGHVVARVAGLSVDKDKARIKAILKAWKHNGALKVANLPDKNGDKRPFVVVGDPVDTNQLTYPHLDKCGAGSAESAVGDPG